MVASSSGAAEDASQEEGDTPATVKKTPVKQVKSWWGTLVEMGKNGPKYQQTLGEALVTRYIIRYV